MNTINQNRQKFIETLCRITEQTIPDVVVATVQYFAGLGSEVTAQQADTILRRNWGNTTYEGTPVRVNVHGVLADLDEVYKAYIPIQTGIKNSHTYKCYNTHVQFNVNCTNVINLNSITGDIASELYQFFLDRANKNIPLHQCHANVGQRLGGMYKLFIVKDVKLNNTFGGRALVYDYDVIAIPLEELTIPSKYNY